jgi:hypothetical protein
MQHPFKTGAPGPATRSLRLAGHGFSRASSAFVHDPAGVGRVKTYFRQKQSTVKVNLPERFFARPKRPHRARL